MESVSDLESSANICSTPGQIRNRLAQRDSSSLGQRFSQQQDIIIDV